MNWYRLQYDCETYQDILTYAMNAEWLGDSRRPSSRRQFIGNAFLLEEPILKALSEFCSYVGIMKMELDLYFENYMDVVKTVKLNLCLHDMQSHTFILEPDVYMNEEQRRGF